MKILFAGDFDPEYNRIKVILDGLKYFKQAEILHYNFNDKSKLNLPGLASACKSADVIFLPSFTHLNVPLIKAVTGKPILFDPLISRYLTKVFDYKKVKRHSPRAWKNFMKDKVSMKMADLVFCDTQAHRGYFHSIIGIPEAKLKILPVGVNTDEFFPADHPPNPIFTVGFYGSFIPLHGTRTIVEAAKRLTDYPIRFEMLGSGFEFEQIKELAMVQYQLTNIHFTGWVDYQSLVTRINSFDLALGIFGNTHKADLVIPNKIFHYAAVKKAIVTKRTPAIGEIFRDKVNIVLCDATPDDIAEKIIHLMNDAGRKNAIAQAGYELITQEYNHKKIAGIFLRAAEELFANKRR